MPTPGDPGPAPCSLADIGRAMLERVARRLLAAAVTAALVAVAGVAAAIAVGIGLVEVARGLELLLQHAGLDPWLAVLLTGAAFVAVPLGALLLARAIFRR